MTYEEAIKTAYTDVEANTETKVKALLGQYKLAEQAAHDEVRKLYSVLAGVPKEDWYKTVIRIDQLSRTITEIRRRYNELSQVADSQIEQTIKDAMSGTYYRIQYVMASFLPTSISTSVIPPNLINAAVTGQAEAIKAITDNIIERYGSLDQYIPKYGTLSKLLAERNTEAVTAIEKNVTQAILQGKSISQLTKDISDTFDTVKWKAARIASAEALRVSSAAQWAQTQDLMAEGLEPQKMWLHVMTTGVDARPAHIALDGKIIDIDQKFKANGHEALYPRGFGAASENIGCKCTYINIVNGVTPKTRTATNPVTGKKEIFEFKSYDEWMEQNNLTAPF
ncbi:MAG TPA: phage minor head protein [Candidatus Omnitrophota bacterium]|nr:phage minor head protein [Candidatus Omnitrophota bacterium]